MKRTVSGLVLSVALLGAAAMSGLSTTTQACFTNECETPTPTATAGKCNSGRGNLSETTPATDCDPGNSGAHNKGGD